LVRKTFVAFHEGRDVPTYSVGVKHPNIVSDRFSQY
jgi:hypothetical protein